MHLTFALPGLCRPDFSLPGHAALPALDTLLRHGRFTPEPCTASVFYARHLWSGSLLEQAKAACGVAEGTPAVFASPLWQQMGMHHMSCLSGADIGIGADEAAELCGGLNGFYRSDGIAFHPYRPDLWLLTLPAPPEWHAPCVLDILGQIDGTTKAEGGGIAHWLALTTECQMWLHRHPLNTRRQHAGQAPVNALWLWNDLTGSATAAIVGSNSVWNQAGCRLNAPSGLPEWQTALHTRQAAFSDGLLFLDDLQTAVHTGNPEAYAAVVQHWEHTFFAPALRLLRRGRLKRITLLTDGTHGGALTCQAPKPWAFWKPKRRFNGRFAP
ncbi:hypothetical protein V9W64_07350 [Neisseria leonii]|uniref:Uncharacterized protein n=1 Tax=Neisseria leonii TaxID=2995413 RepID=A0A9X4E2L2_9NEIS|nr:hypothetical protein [Neisseria sp. 51.81]MDD9328049.1 hypothetical protein [Neisseria sp. 51.81]